MRLIKSITLWIRKKIEPIRSPFHTIYVEEALPRKLKARTLYVVQEDGYTEYAAMLCPCGCKKVLYLNLIPDESPCWKLRTSQDTPTTLHPSIDRTVGCRSHFWFKKGKIVWC